MCRITKRFQSEVANWWTSWCGPGDVVLKKMFRHAGRTWWNCNLLQLENKQIKKTELLLNLTVICAIYIYITSQWQKLIRTDSGKKLDDEVLHLVWAKSVYDRLSLKLIRITFSFTCKWVLYEWVARYPEVNHLHGTIPRLSRQTFLTI